jgi:hypothetical protein
MAACAWYARLRKIDKAGTISDMSQTHVTNNILPAVNLCTVSELPVEIVQISTELFPGPLEVQLETDPEMPDDSFLVLTVHADGPVKNIVRRRREWHRRVSEMLPGREIRLSITSL